MLFGHIPEVCHGLTSQSSWLRGWVVLRLLILVWLIIHCHGERWRMWLHSVFATMACTSLCL